jgi:uncharacterized 2Fe-2S/4Fe-4S cluster protein (DUF4445 family)
MDDESTILQSGMQSEIDLAPITRKYFTEINPPSLADNRADVERLRQSLFPAFGNVHIPFRLVRNISVICRDANWHVTALLGQTDSGWELLNCEAGNTTTRHYGLAIDIGTTTVVASLLDMQTGACLGTAAEYNGQCAYGEDVLTRIFRALESEGAHLLQQAVVSTINGLIRKLCARTEIDNRDIAAVAIGANTVMVHLLLGLDPSRICRAPYIPVLNNSGFLRASDAGIEIFPHAVLYCLPSVGSYVGGDVIAGILVSAMHKRQEVSLLVDIGTNGEIILGNSDWLVACAGAAGPALEGGVVASGMRAEQGAVDKVRIDQNGKVDYHVIGEGKAAGICGSGLVDCLAELLLAGIIDRCGRFVDGRQSLIVVPASKSVNGKDIVITQTDIDNIMRTKGAVNAAVEVLLESVGCAMEDVSHFFAAGAFGKHLDIESAVTIGLYPDLPREKMIQLGNSSLEGARQALLSIDKLKEAEEITSKITYFELNANQSFMNKFVGCKFFPHTNLEYYPTVRARLAERGLFQP